MNIFDHIIEDGSLMGISPLRLVPTGDGKKLYYEFVVYTIATPIAIKSPLFDGTSEEHRGHAVQWQTAYCNIYEVIANANGPEPKSNYLEALRAALGEASAAPQSKIILPGR